MPKLSDVARISRRGGSIPDIDNELAYSAYCLFEAVRTEMIRTKAAVVHRGDAPGFEGPLSVPSIIKYLWPAMDNNSFQDRESEAFQARIALYDYLRNTRNMVCITPGNQHRMSVWWIRQDWSDDHPVSRHGESQQQHQQQEPQQRDESQGNEGMQRCEVCGQQFISLGHKSRHFYKIHIDLDDLVLRVLAEFDRPQYLFAIYKRIIEPPYNFTGGREMVRYNLNTQIEAGIVIAEGERHNKTYRLKDSATPAANATPEPEPQPVQAPTPTVVASSPQMQPLELADIIDMLLDSLSDVAASLRNMAANNNGSHGDDSEADQAELERLRADNNKLRTELANIQRLIANLS